jgi:glycosyltransferase involved in cell wall biosynthesis
MTILIVTSEHKQSGGVASVVRNLALYLQERGHEIIFLYPGRSLIPKAKTTTSGLPAFELNLRLPFREGRHPVLTLGAFLIFFPVSMFHLIRFIQKNNIQVVNIHYPGECWVYFGLCRTFLSYGLVTSVHGADLFPGGRPLPRYSRAIRLLLNLSDRIVVPSRSFRADVCGLFPKLQDKVVAIHNSVDLAELNVLSHYAETDCYKPYILCIAMHNEKKGLDVLLRAFARLQDTEGPLNLVLVGDGPLRGQLEKLSVSLGISEKVQFLGRRGRDRVKQLLHACTVFVLPSRSEPFGIAIIEAMACKKPVIATTAGGIPEIVENGKNGILVPPENPKALAEAILSVLKDEILRNRIAANGHSTVIERFRLEHTGAVYEQTFATLLQDEPQKADNELRSTC